MCRDNSHATSLAIDLKFANHAEQLLAGNQTTELLDNIISVNSLCILLPLFPKRNGLAKVGWVAESALTFLGSLPAADICSRHSSIRKLPALECNESAW